VLPPAVEVPRRDDVRGHAGVVEREERVVVDDEVTTTRARLELLGLVEQLPVAREELVARAPLPLDERLAEEHLPRALWVNAREQDLALRDDRQAVEQHLLEGLRRPLLRGPV